MIKKKKEVSPVPEEKEVKNEKFVAAHEQADKDIENDPDLGLNTGPEDELDEGELDEGELARLEGRDE
ncbi:MAG: hypothetical protein ABI675_27110 [Chitinophagaceae bacterium]